MAVLTASELIAQLSAVPPDAPVRFYVTVTDGDWTDEETHGVDGVHVVQPEDSAESTGEVFLEHAIVR